MIEEPWSKLTQCGVWPVLNGCGKNAEYGVQTADCGVWTRKMRSPKMRTHKMRTLKMRTPQKMIEKNPK